MIVSQCVIFFSISEVLLVRGPSQVMIQLLNVICDLMSWFAICAKVSGRRERIFLFKAGHRFSKKRKKLQIKISKGSRLDSTAKIIDPFWKVKNHRGSEMKQRDRNVFSKESPVCCNNRGSRINSNEYIRKFNSSRERNRCVCVFGRWMTENV